jgi:uncharacterized membrane protein required for colicin V production
MSNALILDLLIILFLLLFALIGFWRGVVKEGLAAGGILFGALLADSWSARFGSIGSNVLSITPTTSRFFTIEALLLAFTIVVGYGSGSLLVPPVRGLGARLGGAVLGAINAALLLAFSLRAVDEFVERSSTRKLLADNRLSYALVQRFNWFLLVVTGIVLVLLFGRLVTEREIRPARQSRDVIGGKRRPARLPAPADAGKLEPVARGFNVDTERFHDDAPALRDLAPMPPISPANVEISHDRYFPFSGGERPDEAGQDWQTIRFSNDAAPLKTPEVRRCANCGEQLTESDEFCPLCGQPAAKSETPHDVDA